MKFTNKIKLNYSKALAMLSSFRVSPFRVCLAMRNSLLVRYASCWKCGIFSDSPEFFCKATTCGVVQSYRLDQLNAFDVFKIKRTYLIDLVKLESEYKNVQKLLHPDKYSNKSHLELAAATETSSAINQAYEVSLAYHPPQADFYHLYMVSKRLHWGFLSVRFSRLPFLGLGIW